MNAASPASWLIFRQTSVSLKIQCLQSYKIIHMQLHCFLQIIIHTDEILLNGLKKLFYVTGLRSEDSARESLILVIARNVRRE